MVRLYPWLAMLQVRNLSIEVGGRVVLEDASFTVRAGDKVGLVGRNGVGKTSLLKVLAGEQPPLTGAIHHSGALGSLPQDPRVTGIDPHVAAVSHVLAGRELDHAATRLEKLRVQLEEDHSAKNVARFARAEEAFRDAGGYAADAEARRIAAGLGLQPERLDLALRVLSGGERRRLELARILFAGSDLLLLDEPTNHLDTDAKTWLMRFLASYRGALIVVSHDLALLDSSITRVLHLDDASLVEYTGTYSQYRLARKADEARQAKLATRQQAEIKRLKTLADSMRHQTEKRARIAKSLDTRVERLKRQAIAAPKRERRVGFRFPTPPHCGNLVLRVHELGKSYGGPPIFEDVTFGLDKGERVLVMGLNGAGKTSLLRIVAGQSEADDGAVRFGTGVSFGYFAQEHEGIEPGVDVLTHMRRSSEEPDQILRALLGMFGLPGEFAFQDAGTLSGGEKTKLALAQLVAGQHNLLLLDEPTNNLDPPSRDAIARALSAWPGSMVIVSHDREFVESLDPDRVVMMPDGVVDFWSPDYLDLVSLA
jgi:ATPase subunit of ABC transporter with duplicated ATPase domains